MKSRLTRGLALALVLVNLSSLGPTAMADPVIPPTWDIVADDFESGGPDVWQTVAPGSLSPPPGVDLLIGGARAYLPTVMREQ
jgi:hypothetical protein